MTVAAASGYDGHGCGGGHEQRRCEEGKEASVARVGRGCRGFARRGRGRVVLATAAAALLPDSVMGHA
jgi:hypothetical protein